MYIGHEEVAVRVLFILFLPCQVEYGRRVKQTKHAKAALINRSTLLYYARKVCFINYAHS